MMAQRWPQNMTLAMRQILYLCVPLESSFQIIFSWYCSHLLIIAWSVKQTKFHYYQYVLCLQNYDDQNEAPNVIFFNFETSPFFEFLPRRVDERSNGDLRPLPGPRKLTYDKLLFIFFNIDIVNWGIGPIQLRQCRQTAIEV